MKRFDIYFVKSALRRHAIQDLYATLGEMLDHDDESSAGFADGLRELVERDFKRTLKAIDRECARFFRQRRKRFSDVQYDAEFFCYLAELGIALPELEKLRNCTNVEELASTIVEEVASEETAEEQPATEESTEQETVNDSAAETAEEITEEVAPEEAENQA